MNDELIIGILPGTSLDGVDAVGQDAFMEVTGLSGSVSVDLESGGLAFADRCQLSVESGSVGWDAVEALH